MKTLLLVDADLDSRTVYRLLLQHAGHAVREAADVTSALQALRAGRPDLIITELVLPGSDGMVLLETMAADPELAAVRRIVLTTNHQEAQRQRCLDLGAVTVLYKPIQPTRLVEEVARVLALPAAR